MQTDVIGFAGSKAQGAIFRRNSLGGVVPVGVPSAVMSSRQLSRRAPVTCMMPLGKLRRTTPDRASCFTQVTGYQQDHTRWPDAFVEVAER